MLNEIVPYLIMRAIYTIILILGIIGWIIWAKIATSHLLLSILPLSTILHGLIFSIFTVLNRLIIIDLSHISINSWSQILRIQEGITITACVYIMIMCYKYERRIT